MKEINKDIIILSLGGISVIHYFIWVFIYPLWASYSYNINNNLTANIIFYSIFMMFVGRTLASNIIPKLISIFGLNSLNMINIILNIL